MSEFKISIIYPNRNKDLVTIKRSLTSLLHQDKKNFKVIFIDYGSREDLKYDTKLLVSSFNFCNFHSFDTQHLPWNRSHAINLGLRIIDSEYVFISDVDMIYQSTFIQELNYIAMPAKVTSFRVAYLSKKNREFTSFNKFIVNKISGEYSTGMSLFNLRDLKKVGLFDEKFIFWGGEDNDIIERLKDNMVSHSFSDKILMYHQWHKKVPSFKDNFFFQLSKFLLTEFRQNIFCKNRLRGTFEPLIRKDFDVIRLKGDRINITYRLNQIIMDNLGQKICVKVSLDKPRTFKYNSGKWNFLLRKINSFLLNYDYQVKWIDDFHKMSDSDFFLQLLNLKLTNGKYFDLVGYEQNFKEINVFLSIDNE